MLPSFDVVRVEPDGESVIAGRAAAGATIDLMRNGQVLSRVVADASGLFAIVPPALAAGTHEITLQTIAPDGTRARSTQSVTVVITAARDERPLVTVSAPDQPTVVLSRPDDAAVPPTATARAGNPGNTGATAPEGRPGEQKTPGPSAPRPEIRIATVEAEGGRLFVSGIAAPGATIRLYLNDALVAPGATGGDGRLSFSIGKGIRPGDYRVRLDDVDPVSGTVRSRAEVPFNVPEPAIASAAPSATPSPAPGPAPAVPTSTPAGNSPADSANAGPASSGVPAGSPAVSSSAPAGSPAAGSPPGAAAVDTLAAGPRTASPPRLASAPTARSDVPENGIPPAGANPAQGNPSQVIVPEVNTAMVVRGDNLWRISKRAYGQGLRYTVIFGANSPQIRNPDLIYPGQVFVIPPGASDAAR